MSLDAMVELVKTGTIHYVAQDETLPELAAVLFHYLELMECPRGTHLTPGSRARIVAKFRRLRFDMIDTDETCMIPHSDVALERARFNTHIVRTVFRRFAPTEIGRSVATASAGAAFEMNGKYVYVCTGTRRPSTHFLQVDAFSGTEAAMHSSSANALVRSNGVVIVVVNVSDTRVPFLVAIPIPGPMLPEPESGVRGSRVELKCVDGGSWTMNGNVVGPWFKTFCVWDAGAASRLVQCVGEMTRTVSLLAVDGEAGAGLGAAGAGVGADDVMTRNVLAKLGLW